ncbi:hypothetical protein F190043G2_09780 [Blautia caecimuris]
MYERGKDYEKAETFKRREENTYENMEKDQRMAACFWDASVPDDNDACKGS